jgi:ABC-2 type transport system ATP-binding protein
VSDALELRDLHFGYGSFRAVDGVSLHLEPGDCYGFLGHNGAGKTTVMRLCLGLLPPTRGEVRVFGADPRRHRREANGLLGALIERPGFHRHVSARHNLVALARLQGMARKLANVETQRVIEAVGLGDAIDRRVGAFSMGMRQRLGIAQAMLGRPRLLLLDEPTNGLDPEGIADLRALLQRLTRDEGVAVMLSSHQLAELDGLCNRVGVLRDGRMVAEGDLDTLRRHVGVRHVVRGTPLETLQQQLTERSLQPVRDGDRLLVDLGTQPAGEVTRALANAAELTSFAPEQATLERIYMQAADVELPLPEARPQQPPTAPPEPAIGRTDAARRRSFWFEATTMLHRRSTLPLLLLPCVVAVFAVDHYSGKVTDGLALVESGERFSADAGSGYLAVAQALQAATPVLALALLWFASQTIAADVSADTLRNTLIRSLRRQDVLVGKVLVLFTTAAVGWFALVATALVASWATVGFGDLEEVSRYGDRDLLAAAADVWPTMLVALSQLTLPLAAIVLLSATASAIARHPAISLAVALVLLLAPDLARLWYPEHDGWLLTSHMPWFWRDQSVLSYLDATARGAADALWLHADLAVWAPLAWMAVAAVALATLVQRMRIS